MNYVSRRFKYRFIFQFIVWRTRPVLIKKYGPAWLNSVHKAAWQEFENLLPEIPFIGKQNVWEYNLILSALYLGWLRSARRGGASKDEAVQLLYDLHEAVAASLPRWLRSIAGRFWNSPAQRRKLRAAAQRSQLRRYPDDWVFVYNDGDGRTIPFGVDISECAILKYYRSLGEESFVPALCKLDFFIGKALCFRFERDGTLAEGCAVCDCRYFLDQETTAWNPSVISDH